MQMMLRAEAPGGHPRLVRGLLVTPLRFWKKGRFEDGEARALAQLAAAREEHRRSHSAGQPNEVGTDLVSPALRWLTGSGCSETWCTCLATPSAWHACHGASASTHASILQG